MAENPPAAALAHRRKSMKRSRRTMGAAGKSLKGGGARKRNRSPAATVSVGGWGAPPHPLTLRAGQRFFPRRGRQKVPFVIQRVDRDGRVRGKTLDGDISPINLSSKRLLVARPDGRGAHYQWHGWTPRRYRTLAQVVSCGVATATLCVPEWHPGRPVTIPTRLLPRESRAPGSWVSCEASLAEPTAGKLEVHVLDSAEAPEPGIYHPPALTLDAHLTPKAPPRLGRGCGDIVVELISEREADQPTEFFLPERVAVAAPGRVYELPAATGRVERYRLIERCRQTPNGTVVRCSATVATLPHPVPGGSGTIEQGHWRWRWWPREKEDDSCDHWVFSPDEHNQDWVLTRRPLRASRVA
jgi:hypothetical protein